MKEIILHLLNWHFFLLIFSCLFIYIFKEEIRIFLYRNIDAKFGDNYISIRDIPENLSKDIDPIRGDIEEALKAILKIQELINVPDKERLEPKIDYSSGHASENTLKEVEKALSGNWHGKWRSVKRLSFIVKISEEQLLSLLKENSNIELSKDSSGRHIAKMREFSPLESE